MTPAASFIDALKFAAERSARAEDDFRREISERTKILERERTFAYRRLNFMREIAAAVSTAEDEESAVAVAASVMRTKLGWSDESDARVEVTKHFASVARQVFADLTPADAKENSRADVVGELCKFEEWYRETHPNVFWVLFEHYLPETPRVDF